MAHWLVKSEPDAFSWDQQVENKVEPWTGVRNALAAKNLRTMQKGDLAFFYHSNTKEPGIVGTMEIVEEHSPDCMFSLPVDSQRCSCWLLLT